MFSVVIKHIACAPYAGDGVVDGGAQVRAHVVGGGVVEALELALELLAAALQPRVLVVALRPAHTCHAIV